MDDVDVKTTDQHSLAQINDDCSSGLLSLADCHRGGKETFLLSFHPTENDHPNVEDSAYPPCSLLIRGVVARR